MRKLEAAKKSGAKFENPVPTELGGLSLMFKVLPKFLSNRAARAPRIPPGPFHTETSVYADAPGSGLRVTWFGHSSLLLEIDGVRLLVDPVWDERASPFSFSGPKRFFPPTLPLEDLPALDAILISHDHYDHLGKQTVRGLARLQPEAAWITSLGVGRLLKRFGVRAGQVRELDWTGSTLVRGRSGDSQQELEVTAVPARHFSGRSLGNRMKTLWSAFVLRGSRHTVYYGADTGLWDGLTAIAEQFGPFDLTLLEIGAFNELWRDIHLGPDGAAQAFAELGGGTLMPIHWGLFDLALHGWREPIERIGELAAERGLRLFSPTPGLPVEILPAMELSSDWWKAVG